MTYTHGHHESVLRSHKWRTVDNSAAYLAPRLTSGTFSLGLPSVEATGRWRERGACAGGAEPRDGGWSSRRNLSAV